MAGTTFAVGLEFNAKTKSLDDAVRKLNAVNTASAKTAGGANNIRKFGEAGKAAAVGVKGLGSAFTAALGPMGALLSATALLTKGFQTLAAQDFAEAKVRTLGVNSQELVQNLKAVSAELQGQASVAELTAASYDVASAGFNTAAEASKVLKAAAQGAVGGFTDMNTAGNALTSVLNAYGLSADSATQIMDQFIQTQNDGKIVVAEYAANIGKVAAAAASLNIPLAEVNAAIAQSTAAGVNAEMAFTGVKSALARLASGEAAKVLEGTGLSLDAASLAADGLVGTLKKMKEAGLDTGQIFKALGTEAAPALLPLLNNLERTEELLQNQANSAGVASAAMSEATNTIQGAWKNVQTQIENFFSDQSALGEALKFTLNALAYVLKELGDRINFLLTPFKLILQVITSVASYVSKLGAAVREAFADTKGAMLLQEIFKKMEQILPKIGTILMEFLVPALQKVIGFATEAAKFLGEVLYGALDKIVRGAIAILRLIPGMGGIANGLESAWNNVTTRIEEASARLESHKKSTEETKDKYVELKDAVGDVAEEAKKLEKAQREITKRIQEAITAADQAAASQSAILEQQISVQQARLQAETAINGVLLEQAQRQLQAAKTEQDRIAAANAIYELTVKQADIQLKLAKASIQAEIDRAKLALESAQLKEREVAAIVALAKAQGIATKEHEAALKAQQEAVKLAEIQLGTARLISKERLRAAEAVHKGQLETAKAQLAANLLAKETGRAANEAARYASNMSKGAAAASSAAASKTSTLNVVGTNFGAAGQNKYFQAELRQAMKGVEEMGEKYKGMWDTAGMISTKIANASREVMERFMKMAQEYNARQEQSGLGDAKEQFYGRGYATGGYVSSPEVAMVGEGGQPEYIIPASKMEAAMQNYAAGRRGSGVLGTPQVNIQTGPVTQMNGTDYVSKADLSKATQDAVAQTVNLLRSNPSVRRSIGVSR